MVGEAQLLYRRYSMKIGSIGMAFISIDVTKLKIFLRNILIKLVVTTMQFPSTNPDSKVHGANMGPTWVLLSDDGWIYAKYSVIDTSLARWVVPCVFQFLYATLIARFMGPIWGPSGADRTQPRWAPCWPHEPCCLGIYCGRCGTVWNCQSNRTAL